eukprot:6097519-Amphidinium_carterae.1
MVKQHYQHMLVCTTEHRESFNNHMNLLDLYTDVVMSISDGAWFGWFQCFMSARAIAHGL